MSSEEIRGLEKEIRWTGANSEDTRQVEVLLKM